MNTNLDVSQNFKFAPEESINDRESILRPNKSLSEIQHIQHTQSVNEEVSNIISTYYLAQTCKRA